jgi:hypothetical protein
MESAAYRRGDDLDTHDVGKDVVDLGRVDALHVRACEVARDRDGLQTVRTWLWLWTCAPSHLAASQARVWRDGGVPEPVSLRAERALAEHRARDGEDGGRKERSVHDCRAG